MTKTYRPFLYTTHVVAVLLMLALLFASVWCWAIIIDKVITLRRTREKMKAFEEKVVKEKKTEAKPKTRKASTKKS